MRDKAIDILRSKGVKDPEGAVNELMRSGALTEYDLCKYVAVEMWHERLVRYPDKAPTTIIKEVADACHLGENTLRRML